MHRPRVVKIIGKSYSVQFFRQLPGGIAGRSSPRRQTLQVATRRRHREYQRDTLLHETIHALDYQMCLGLRERQVHALASGLTQVLWDNPAFARYLLDHE